MTPRLIGFLIILAFGFLTPLTAEAQPSAKVPRIGWLSQGSPPSGAHPNLEAFREGLRGLGWVEGENLVIEYRWAGIRDDRLPALADELVRLPVDVIFATPDVAAHAAKNATTTIPIVFRGHPDPVGRELITSLAQPGGNITGLSTMLTELSGKRLELLKEAVPEVTRVAVLWNPALPRHTQPGLEQTLARTETQRAAHALGVQLQLVAAEGPDAFDRAFAVMTREHAEALVVLPHVLFGTHRRRLIALAAERRLPTIFWRGFFAEDGALMAYGPNLVTNAAALRPTWTRSSRAPSLGTCPWNSPPRSSSSST